MITFRDFYHTCYQLAASEIIRYTPVDAPDTLRITYGGRHVTYGRVENGQFHGIVSFRFLLFADGVGQVLVREIRSGDVYEYPIDSLFWEPATFDHPEWIQHIYDPEFNFAFLCYCVRPWLSPV